MRAVILKGYGGLDNVALGDVPRPAIEQPTDVVVAMKAAALNHLDLFVVGGLPGITHAFPFILGGDGAGVVEAVGSAVRRVKPGDRVLINPGIWCGRCEFCMAGEQSLCQSYSLLGEHLPGTLAEAAKVPEANVHLLPAHTDFPEASAYALAFLTAWRMLMTRARLQPQETVLVWGIGGGVALAALAIAKQAGARVIVTSGSDDKLAKAKALGADEVINHRTADVAKEVRRLTNRRGAEVVVDSIGTETWETSLKALARTGRLVTCGGTSGPMVTTDVRRLFWHQYTIMGSTMGNAREMEAVLGLLHRGALKAVVDSVVPFGEARSAFERMQRGGQFGKIVVAIDR